MAAVASRPRISVITVTRARKQLMLQKLESLAQQTLEPSRFELVVFVNGCPDGTLEALRQAEVPFAMRLLAFDSNEGVARGRNVCAAAARGDILYFSDDDCLLLPDTLEKHLAAHETFDERCVAVGSVRFEYEGAYEYLRLRQVRYWNLNGVNTSLPRAAFEATGGFDERLKTYGLEDVLLGYRLHRQGVRFRSLPDVLIRHIGPNPMRAGDQGKAKSAGHNAAAVVAHYPELAWRLGVHPLAMAVKRLALAPPGGYLWRAIDRASYDYERAYLGGALEEREHGR